MTWLAPCACASASGPEATLVPGGSTRFALMLFWGVPKKGEHGASLLYQVHVGVVNGVLRAGKQVVRLSPPQSQLLPLHPALGAQRPPWPQLHVVQAEPAQAGLPPCLAVML